MSDTAWTSVTAAAVRIFTPTLAKPAPPQKERYWAFFHGFVASMIFTALTFLLRGKINYLPDRPTTQSMILTSISGGCWLLTLVYMLWRRAAMNWYLQNFMFRHRGWQLIFTVKRYFDGTFDYEDYRTLIDIPLRTGFILAGSDWIMSTITYILWEVNIIQRERDELLARLNSYFSNLTVIVKAREEKHSRPIGKDSLPSTDLMKWADHLLWSEIAGNTKDLMWLLEAIDKEGWPSLESRYEASRPKSLDRLRRSEFRFGNFSSGSNDESIDTTHAYCASCSVCTSNKRWKMDGFWYFLLAQVRELQKDVSTTDKGTKTEDCEKETEAVPSRPRAQTDPGCESHPISVVENGGDYQVLLSKLGFDPKKTSITVKEVEDVNGDDHVSITEDEAWSYCDGKWNAEAESMV